MDSVEGTQQQHNEANDEGFGIVDEDTGSMVLVPLNDEETDDTPRRTTSHSVATDHTDHKGNRSISHTPVSRKDVGHRKKSSRIGIVYRSTREKGIHVAAPSGHDLSPVEVEVDLDEMEGEDGHAFDVTMKDPTYLAAVKKARLVVDPDLVFYLVGHG